MTIIEGIKEISMALTAGVVFEEFYICGEAIGQNKDLKGLIKKIESLKKPIYDVSEQIYAKITYGDRDEGLLAVAHTPRLSLADLKRVGLSLIVVVTQVEKPGNLGAILRTCDAVGVDGVIVCDPKTDIYNPNVIRSSLGAIFGLKVAQATSEDAYKFLKSNDLKVYATTPQAKESYAASDFRRPVAVVVGAEKEGLNDFWLQKGDQKIYIPMKGRIDSLNVSVSTAVVLYEVLRQREFVIPA